MKNKNCVASLDDSENGDRNNNGLWIGIDLGTTNSTCAVWDSNRGGPKWIRLSQVATPTTAERRNGKIGRIMPSIVGFRSTAMTTPSSSLSKDDDSQVLVGQQVIDALRHQSNDEYKAAGTACSGNMSIFHSVKRLLGKTYDELDPSWTQSLDFEIKPEINDEYTADEDDEAGGREPRELLLIGRTKSSSTIETSPVEILSLELQAIRLAAQAYVDKYMIKKNLKIPGSGSTTDSSNRNKKPDNRRDKKRRMSAIPICNVVVGVPAHYSQRHIRFLTVAGRRAGFTGHIGTCLESTAAAMAYGLTLQELPPRSISSSDGNIGNVPTAKNQQIREGQVLMVIDMGGGTTDITIARKKNTTSNSRDDDDRGTSSYEVLVTEGDDRLGGDDIDQAMIEFCIGRVKNLDPLLVDRQQLRSRCRQAKESLCHQDRASLSESETIVVCEGCEQGSNNRNEERVVIDQLLFGEILAPWLAKAKGLILETKKRLDDANNGDVNEVVLVGGTTRIPAIRSMIQSLFPHVELSTSLNPMSSVAQGLAIQAAISSKLVPLHELKSALMLDCVPHAIGVQLTGNGSSPTKTSFVEIIQRNQRLPARGSATFTLADKQQPGVTIRAVEKISHNQYEPMCREDFTFLLRRLSASEFQKLDVRTIEVGMCVESDGKFIVSVFDELDPEQVRKRKRYEEVTKGNEDPLGELGLIKDLLTDESGLTTEQLFLYGTLLGLIVVYFAVRVAFTDPTADGGKII